MLKEVGRERVEESNPRLFSHATFYTCAWSDAEASVRQQRAATMGWGNGWRRMLRSFIKKCAIFSVGQEESLALGGAAESGDFFGREPDHISQSPHVSPHERVVIM